MVEISFLLKLKRILCGVDVRYLLRLSLPHLRLLVRLRCGKPSVRRSSCPSPCPAFTFSASCVASVSKSEMLYPRDGDRIVYLES
jgi:hypothetical protein